VGEGFERGGKETEGVDASINTKEIINQDNNKSKLKES
jgi:hypothetical protein